ncbi:MAG: phosphopentomutase, partial [Erysipelotrichaceae bacterium]|nr:phosphopentomutase [Erysipelotrichaceae bacterium]
VDFDALWGHRRNPEGYAKELENFDIKLGELIKELRDDDLLILTADHGNDPTHTGTDHTREMVPMLYYSKSFTGSGLLPLSKTFANVGATIADNFNVKMPDYGQSMMSYLK